MILTRDEVELEQQDRDYRHQRLRAERLRRAGYGLGAAVLLAASPEVDVDRAVELLARGCAHDTALQILL